MTEVLKFYHITDTHHYALSALGFSDEKTRNV